jgi:ribosome maturation factor RimP
MSKIIDAVTVLASPVAAKHDCELWDVEYVKEAGDWFLRIYIDRPDGISITHCEAVSRELDPLLDELEDVIPGSYTFEVSSAGIERRLYRPSDFERFMGSHVELKLYKSRDGKKDFTGDLAGYDDGNVTINISGQPQTFEKSEIAHVRLKFV